MNNFKTEKKQIVFLIKTEKKQNSLLWRISRGLQWENKPQTKRVGYVANDLMHKKRTSNMLGPIFGRDLQFLLCN